VHGNIGVGALAYSSSFTKVGNYQLAPATSYGAMYLYPGFSRTTSSGLKYGAASEFRTASFNPGLGINENSTSTQGIGALVLRRAYVFLSSPRLGTVQVGQSNGPFTNFQSTVIMYGFDDYNSWITDGGAANSFPTGVQANSLSASAGPLYTVSKIAYFTPSFHGLEFGISFAPTSQGFKEGIANCNAATSTCAALSGEAYIAPAAGVTSNFSDFQTRQQNTLETGLHYSHSVNKDLSFTASVSYLHSTPLANTGSVPIPNGNFAPLNLMQYDVSMTYKKLALAYNVKDGQENSYYRFQQIGAHNAINPVAAINYTMGPWVLGAYTSDYTNSGAYRPGITSSTEEDKTADIGGKYYINKYIDIYFSYLWDHRQQAGVDFSNYGGAVGGGGTVGPRTLGQAASHGVTIGTTVQW
jgi:predicted porin